MSVSSVLKRYAQRLESIYCLKDGGELRAARGELVESLVKECCELVGLDYRKGTSDFQTISVKGYTKKHQVDGHVYKNGKLILIIEAKSYLDLCYYERACHDFKVMKLKHPSVPCILVSL